MANNTTHGRIMQCLSAVITEKAWSHTDNPVLFGAGAALDSLGFIAFLIEVEKEFSVKLTGESILSLPNNVFHDAASLAAYIDSMSAPKGVSTLKKLLIVDADNTLWEGELAEGNMSGKRTYMELFDKIHELVDKGVLATICSHNDQKSLENCIEGILPWGRGQIGWVEIVGTWESKDIAVRGILKRLNLLPESAVFMDDSPLERALVQETTGVIAPAWTHEDYSPIFSLFTAPEHQTEESRNRTRMYLEEKERERSKEGMPYEEWLKSIEQVIDIHRADAREFDRAIELNSRANQFNMTKRGPLFSSCFVISLRDKFGDMGIVGWLSAGPRNDHNRRVIENIVISCRAFGRGLETMIYKYIFDNYYEPVVMFIDTGKNAKAKEFYASLAPHRRCS